MDRNLSLRGSTALGLSIARQFLNEADLSTEDKTLSTQGLELSWKWVEGDEVDPHAICEYIDGEINLPFRSTLYESGSMASQAMAAIFLSIGLAALHACREKGKAASESVENFGDNEWEALIHISHSLPQEKQEAIVQIRSRLTALTEKDRGEFGARIKRTDLGEY